MKRITTVLTVLGCSLLCATAANAADITSSGYAGGTYSVSGTTDGQTPVRIEILKNGCVFDDLTLADFEVAVLGSVETPFTYEDYDFLDKI